VRRRLAVLCLTLAACGPPQVETRALTALNPTSYVFHASVGEVHGAVEQLYTQQFSRRPLNAFSIVRADDELLTDEQRRALARPGGEDDLYLAYMHSPMGLSNVYFAGGEPAPYIADFDLQIASVDDERTRVVVHALDAQVIAGKTWLPRHHMTRANIYVSVQPTTVEEYRLLLGIGEILGEPSMPALRLPE